MEKEYAYFTMKKMNPKPAIIVVTGAESTGKSVLTKQLADFFSCPYFPEYAREYLENSESSYTCEDILNIARMQKKQMEEAQRLPDKYVFLDTWLIITKVWLEVVCNKAPEWITDTIRQSKVSLFLLCANDIPWIPDPLRENGGEKRDELFHIYRDNLELSGFPYRIVSGAGEERFTNALQIIRESL
jgi:NadR type nicotinamide-nucleotide adenylyltransferase